MTPAGRCPSGLPPFLTHSPALSQQPAANPSYFCHVQLLARSEPPSLSGVGGKITRRPPQINQSLNSCVWYCVGFSRRDPGRGVLFSPGSIDQETVPPRQNNQVLFDWSSTIWQFIPFFTGSLRPRGRPRVDVGPASRDAGPASTRGRSPATSTSAQFGRSRSRCKSGTAMERAGPCKIELAKFDQAWIPGGPCPQSGCLNPPKYREMCAECPGPSAATRRSLSAPSARSMDPVSFVLR